jgi:hypothetical protein
MGHCRHRCTTIRAATAVLAIALSASAASGAIAQTLIEPKFEAKISASGIGQTAARSADQSLQHFRRWVCPASGHRYLRQDWRLYND